MLKITAATESAAKANIINLEDNVNGSRNFNRILYDFLYLSDPAGFSEKKTTSKFVTK